MQRKTSRRSKNSDTTQTKVYKLIQLKKKQDKLALEMQKLKDELYQEILKAPKNKLICSEGNVALNTSRSWSLPPINAVKAQEILGDSFTFYFKEKLSYGVEQLAKNKINDENDELGQKLQTLIELKESQSWTIEVNK